MELVVMWIIVLGQFFVIGWLAYPRFVEPKPTKLASLWHEAVSSAYVDGALSADAAGVMYEKNPYRSAGAGE